jgi:hypothetical protein
MRWLIVGIAVLTFAIAGAGCGGGDDEASDTDTTAIVDTTTDDTTTDEATDETSTETTDTDTDTGTGNLSGDCLEAVQAYSAALAAAGSGGSSEDAAESLRAFAEQAPEEIRDDFEVLAQAVGKYFDELQDLGLSSGEQPSAEDIAKLSAAAAAFNDADVQAANENVSAWADENC